MKNQKIKMFTLMLASVLGAAALTGAALTVPAKADETTTVTDAYAVSDVFSASGATLNTSGDVTSFAIKNEGAVSLKQRDLALKWYAKQDDEVKVNYLTFKLAFEDTNFETVSVSIETAVAVASKEKKATNKIVFKNVDGKIYAGVNETINVADGNVITVMINEEAVEYGEFNVIIDDGSKNADDTTKLKTVGKLTNVGSYFGDYASATAATPLTPFTIEAKMPKGAESSVATTVRLVELNGQSFALTNGQIVDNAAPVVVVNDEISTITLGTAWSVDYEVIDVLYRSVTKTVKYAQYSPTVADDKMEYKSLSTSTYFYDTNYMDGNVEKSVFKEMGKEYLSVKFAVSDKSYKDVEYFLSWYAVATERPAATTLDPDGSSIDYIVMDKNEEGAYYTFLEADTQAKENRIIDQQAIDDYQKAVTEAAADLKAGSTTDFNLPSFKGMINDNGGVKNLTFTISYRSSNGSSATPKTSMTISTLKFPVAKAGDYEFKVFAVDKANNSMMYYNEDGELVEVSSSNVWDIDEIPYFTFSVNTTNLSIDTTDDAESDRKESLTVGSTFDDFDVTVVGDSASDAKVSAKLYYVDVDKYNQKNPTQVITASDLSKISYSMIEERAATNRDNATEAITDYDRFYLEVYAELLAERIVGATKEALLDETSGIFRAINEYNPKINEEDHPDEYASDNVFNWNSSDITFTAVSEGDVYVVIGVYSDAMIPGLKACGYKVITVQSQADVIPGETEWLKNNIVSVVLFSIAGVMLILIIILLLIKPTDETLEDVDKKAKTVKTKKDKKSKK